MCVTAYTTENSILARVCVSLCCEIDKLAQKPDEIWWAPVFGVAISSFLFSKRPANQTHDDVSIVVVFMLKGICSNAFLARSSPHRLAVYRQQTRSMAKSYSDKDISILFMCFAFSPPTKGMFKRRKTKILDIASFFRKYFRYFAIVRPMQYSRKMTPTRANGLLIFAWCLGLVCALPPCFGWSS